MSAAVTIDRSTWAAVLSDGTARPAIDDSWLQVLQDAIRQLGDGGAPAWVSLFDTLASLGCKDYENLWLELTDGEKQYDRAAVKHCIAALDTRAGLQAAFLQYCAARSAELCGKNDVFEAIVQHWHKLNDPALVLFAKQVALALRRRSSQDMALAWLHDRRVWELVAVDASDFLDGLLDLAIGPDVHHQTAARSLVQQLLLAGSKEVERLHATLEAWIRRHMSSVEDTDIMHALEVVKLVARSAPSAVKAIFRDDDLLGDVLLEMESLDEIALAMLQTLSVIDVGALPVGQRSRILEAAERQPEPPEIVVAATNLRFVWGMLKLDAELEQLAPSLHAARTILSTDRDDIDDGDTITLLARLASHPGCRQYIADELVPVLLRSPRRKQPSLELLALLSSLTAPPARQGSEEHAMRALHAKAASAEGRATHQETTEDIRLRVQGFVATGVLDLLASTGPSTTKLTRTEVLLLVTIVSNMAITGAVANELARAGFLRRLLVIAQQYGNSDDEVMEQVRTALATLLVSLDPNLVFGGQSSALDATHLLLRNIDPYASGGGGGGQLGDEVKYRSLMSLTNLCSLGNDVCRIVAGKWDDVKIACQDVEPAIVRAATELVCNLCSDAAGARLFLNPARPQAGGDLAFLLELASGDEVDDVATRRAATGALAMLSGLTVSVSAFQKIAPDLVRLFVADAEEGDLEVIHRLAVVLVNVLSQAKFIDADLVDSIRTKIAKVRSRSDIVGEDLMETLAALESVL